MIEYYQMARKRGGKEQKRRSVESKKIRIHSVTVRPGHVFKFNEFQTEEDVLKEKDASSLRKKSNACIGKTLIDVERRDFLLLPDRVIKILTFHLSRDLSSRSSPRNVLILLSLLISYKYEYK